MQNTFELAIPDLECTVNGLYIKKAALKGDDWHIACIFTFYLQKDCVYCVSVRVLQNQPF